MDDDDANRQIVTALLTLNGYCVHEASDGQVGLEVALAVQPQLVISEIVMPSVDGYEFVRRLRAHPQLEAVKVILYSASYNEGEAQHLAEACRVARVLPKPCAPPGMLSALQEVLQEAPCANTKICIGEGFDQEHLQVISNKLAEKVEELGAANARLKALTEFNLQLASERDPRTLVEKVCYGARNLLGAKYAVLVVNERHQADSVFFATSGLTFPGCSSAMMPPLDGGGPLGRVFNARITWRASRGDSDLPLAVLPAGYPAANAYVAAPISSLTHTYGWLCLADKLGAAEFDAEDERILGILAAQVGRIYENGSLTYEIQMHATQLLVEMDERERATVQLRNSEELLRQLAENIQDVFFITLPDYRDMIYVSPAFEKIWGRKLTSLRLADLREAIHIEDRERIVKRLQGHVGKAINDEMEYRIVQHGGAVRWLSTRLFTVCDDRGQPFRVVGVSADVTERKEAEARIRRLNRVYRLFSGINALVVRAQNQDALFIDACHLAVDQGDFRLAWVGCVMAGEERVTPVAWAGDDFLVTQSFRDCIPVLLDSDDFLFAAIREQEPRVCNDLRAERQTVLYHKEMIERGFRSMITLPLVVHGNTVGCLVLATDHPGSFDAAEMQLLVELSENLSFALDRFEKVRELNYLAYYDGLTGLPNRAYFTEQLSRRLPMSKQSGAQLAVVIADPERFDTINDTFGRNHGDALLKEIARRLLTYSGDIDSVARIGAGQFAMILPFVGSAPAATEVYQELYKSWLAAPFSIAGHDLAVSVRAGISIYPNDGINAESLLKNADSALKRAKATDEKTVLFTRQISDWIAERLSMETRLRRALEKREFVLHYQPKVDAEARRLQGVEALLRWENPELGLMPPAKFIPLMEDTGIIVDVGAWVLQQASVDRALWRNAGLPAPRIAVNVSTVQLRRPDFVEMVRRVVRPGDSPVGQEDEAGAGIDIEVTESLLVDRADANADKLRAIRDFGMEIAIDDFGTGYASLGYLARLPVHSIKIDRSFIVAMLDDPSAMTLVSTMIALAHSLKLKAVAEGVETEEQAKLLRLLRCDQIQGFLISKPLPYVEMTALLQRLAESSG
ncbi:MAG: EAL domain-containing protein [Steroidobacteraceae bacterium]